MNIVLWIFQIVLALLCISGGAFQIFKLDELRKGVAAMRALPRGAPAGRLVAARRHWVLGWPRVARAGHERDCAGCRRHRRPIPCDKRTLRAVS